MVYRPYRPFSGWESDGHLSKEQIELVRAMHRHRIKGQSFSRSQVIEAVYHDGMRLKECQAYAHDEFIVQIALRNDPLAWQFVHGALKNDARLFPPSLQKTLDDIVVAAKKRPESPTVCTKGARQQQYLKAYLTLITERLDKKISALDEVQSSKSAVFNEIKDTLAALQEKESIGHDEFETANKTIATLIDNQSKELGKHRHVLNNILQTVVSWFSLDIVLGVHTDSLKMTRQIQQDMKGFERTLHRQSKLKQTLHQLKRAQKTDSALTDDNHLETASTEKNVMSKISQASSAKPQ